MKRHTFISRWTQLKQLVERFIMVLLQRKVAAIKITAFLSFLYQFLVHRRWWSGVIDTGVVVIRHLRPSAFCRQVLQASDGEEYCIWTPRRQPRIFSSSHKTHIWNCLPGGMESIEPGFLGMIAGGVFAASRVCIFNNPGISTRMRHKVLPSPTETRYVIEYIRALQREHDGCRVSLIGFSIGSVQALRTLHTVCNDRAQFGDVHIRSVILVHAPDIVREAICSFQVRFF